MKKRFIIVLGVVSFLALCFVGFRHSMATQQEASTGISGAFVPDEVLVKFRTSASDAVITAAIDAVNGQIVTHLGRTISTAEWSIVKSAENRSFIGDPSLFHITVPPSLGETKAIAQLLKDPLVEYAEKNAIYTADVVPNDTLFSQQWALNNTGQTGGTPDADIDAPEAWNIFEGSSNVVVAVIDSGIDYNHDDLSANIWTNPGETGNGKESDGIDNDGNGYIDDWHGWNFVAGNNTPMDDMWYQQTYHGTHVSGIIGARTNNSLGVAGVCWNVKLMAVKALAQDGTGTTANLVNAIDYARINSANIINASWGGTTYSISLYGAIGRAQTGGILFVAAAGNDGVNNDIAPHYPASYESDNVISVLSTTHTDALSSFSDYGNYGVDLGAPGGSNTDRNDPSNIYSTKYNQAYQRLAGTSMAAPHVSGVAALVVGQRPTIGWWLHKTIVLKSADHIPSLVQKCSTAGRLNAYNALTYATPTLPNAPTNLFGTATDKGGGFFDITLTWTDNSDNEMGFNIYLQSGNVYQRLDTVGPNVTSYVLSDVPRGYYYFYVRAYAADGESLRTGIFGVKAY